MAIKVIPRTHTTAESEERFRCEASTASTLHHPSLAEVHGFGIDADILFYAMRLIEGSSLQVALDRAASRSELRQDLAYRRRVVARVREIASALATVHARGLVHGDVKPSNILLECHSKDEEPLPDCRAVLVDFGLSRPSAAGLFTDAAASMGTPEFAAPELLDGRPIDARADVFALGVTLHDLLARRRARERRTPALGLEPIESLVPGIDPDLAAVVGMARDPKREARYADAGELHGDLVAWEAGEEVLARRLPMLERARRHVRRHPDRLVRTLAGAALLIGAGSGSAWIGRQIAHRSEARIALDDGDVPRTLLELGAMPEWIAPWILRDSQLEERLVRAASERSDDAYARIAEISDAGGDFRDALLAAATQLRVSGWTSDSVLVSFLGRSLGGSVAPRTRTAALQVIARLCYERPVRSGDELQAVEPLLGELRRLRASGRVIQSREESLYLLTALSGCATLDDLDGLVEESIRYVANTEERRLALWCSERIVRRALARGDVVALARRPWRELVIAELAAVQARSLESSKSISDGEILAWTRWATTCALAERAESGDGAAQVWLRDDIAESAAGGEAALLGAVDLLAATAHTAFDAAMHEFLASPGSRETLMGDSIRHARAWGRRLGLRGDEAFIARFAANLSRGEVAGAGSQLVRDFEHSVEEGRRERVCGEVSSLDLDESTMLVWTSPGELNDLRVDPRDWTEFDATGWEHLSVVRGLDSTLALWDFRSTPSLRVHGGAESAAVLDADWNGGDPPVHSVNFTHFGSSELQLELQLGESTRDTLDLVLLGLVTVRPYYPYRGTACVTVEVDEVTVAPGIPLVERADSEVRIPLAREHLTQGRHRIAIRSSSTSTAVYRLFGVALCNAR